MTTARVFFIAVGLIFSAQFGFTQDVTRYRGYVLESSLDSVVTIHRGQATDAKTLHDRPAKIQELEWRAQYWSTGSEMADPVRDITFAFVDDALYQMVVTYDRGRTDGLTNSDLIASLTAVYGEPTARSAKSRPVAAPPDTAVIAQWDGTGVVADTPSRHLLARHSADPGVEGVEHPRAERHPRGYSVGRRRGATPRIGTAQERGC